MEGVNIIASFEAAIEYAFNWMNFLSFLVVTLIAAVIFIVYNYKKNIYSKSDLCLAGILFIILGCTFGGLLGFRTQKPIKYETRYLALISDSVSLVEFMENYEILEHCGKVYTLKDRE